jgi:hypothetical protein
MTERKPRHFDIGEILKDKDLRKNWSYSVSPIASETPSLRISMRVCHHQPRREITLT